MGDIIEKYKIKVIFGKENLDDILVKIILKKIRRVKHESK